MIIPPAAADPLAGAALSPWTTLLAVAILVPVSFWVYNDAKMRYNSAVTPLLWAFLVFAALIVFLPLYLLLRPAGRGGTK
ncbi:MAG TPA: hypothetical protein VMF29_00030 [Candidatus Edwardsbacteria bacterium]|nr:hypothetical protein [Candidatus Edwardsbacteria bacterium]